MSGETNKDLPDPTDKEALETWLADKPRPLVVAFAARIALMALPGLGTLEEKDSKATWGMSLELATFRAVSASLAAAKYPGQATRDAAAAHNKINQVAVIGAAAALALDPKRYAVDAANAVIDIAYANIKNTIGLEAVLTTEDGAIITTEDGARISWPISAGSELRAQIVAALDEARTADSRPNGIAWYLSRPVWIDGNLPSAIQELWVKLRGNLPQSEYWDVWLDWAEARFRGQADWPKPVYDELTKWREEWYRDAAVVNADIKRLLEDFKTPDGAPPIPEAELGPQFVFGDQGLTHIESAAATDSANRDNREALHRQLQALVPRLTELCGQTHNTHPRLSQTVQDYARLIGRPFGELPIIDVWCAGLGLVQASIQYTNMAPSALTERLEPAQATLLNQIAAIHGAFVLSYPEVQQLMDRAERMKSDVPLASAIDQPTRALLARLAAADKWIDERTRRFLDGVRANYEAAGWKLAGVGFSGYGTVRNALLAATRVLMKVNSILATVIGAYALNQVDPGLAATTAALDFVLLNSKDILNFAAPIPELRVWFSWVIDQLERANPRGKSDKGPPT